MPEIHIAYPILLILPCIAIAISRHPTCSEYGLNWAAEIRCLRSLLNKCYQHANALNVKDSKATIRHMSKYYGIPDHLKGKSHLLEINHLEAKRTTSPPSSSSSSTTTTTTTTSAPNINNIAATIPSINVAEIRATLLNEATRKIRDLESQFSMELKIIEERWKDKIDAIRWEADNELRKLNKTIHLMTRRIYRFGKSEYIYVDEMQSWYGAEEQCRKWGGHLASIMDLAENEFLKGIYKWFSWIGLNDVQKESKYIWTDGSDLRFLNWKRGQPDNAEHNENCAEIGPDGFWMDSFCMGGRHYICKRR